MTIQGRDSTSSTLTIHFNETKTARTAAVSVRDNLGRIYLSMTRKKAFQILVSHTPGEISYIYFQSNAPTL